MGDFIHVRTSNSQTRLRATSGAIRFKLGSIRRDPDILLLSETLEELYKIVIGPQLEVVNVKEHDLLGSVRNPRHGNPRDVQDFFITWYNGQIRIGCEERLKPLLVVSIDVKQSIGYVQFESLYVRGAGHGFTIERSPINFKPVIKKPVQDGQLYWSSMNREDELPPDAFIGGFENGPLYISRAYHAGSICPGKYVPAKRLAYIPWGDREHAKEEFEVLCGFNGSWVSTRNDYIPENAFIAGTSEIREAPLYIGRAMHDGYLLNGKVHTIHKTCHLPYKGKEIQSEHYEILVSGNDIPRGVFGQTDTPDMAHMAILSRYSSL